MSLEQNIFVLFGGIRPMARAVGVSPSNVAAWKRMGRIPAEKQPHVLEVGQAMGLAITAEHVVFPLGRPNAAGPDDLAADPAPVAFNRTRKMQRKDID